MGTKRNLKRDIEILRRMVAYYSELPDATLHLLRGLEGGKDALEHRWEVTHSWAKYPDKGEAEG